MGLLYYHLDFIDVQYWDDLAFKWTSSDHHSLTRLLISLISFEALRAAIEKDIRAYHGRGKLFSSWPSLLEEYANKLSLARAQSFTQASSSAGAGTSSRRERWRKGHNPPPREKYKNPNRKKRRLHERR